MPDVTFSVLGSVEVSVGDRGAVPGGGRQRALLAALLLSAGRVVSVDRLVDELWGERPPSSARTQVHTLVHRVRRTLGEAAELLETRPPGYLLRARPTQVDLAVFTELVDQAGEHAGAGRLAEAADAFREALAIWRGPALDGADGAFVPREAARLEEMRLAATEQCLAVELDLGRHGAIVAELASLVGEHPLREELRAGLMLALYRCGRRSEALRTYRDGRTLLIEETGLEPAERLRDLHEAILRDEVEPWRAESNPPEPEPADAPTGTGEPAAHVLEPARGHELPHDPAAVRGPGRAHRPASAPAEKTARDQRPARGLEDGRGPDRVDRGARVPEVPGRGRGRGAGSGAVVPRLGVGVVLVLVALACLGGATAEPSSPAGEEVSRQGRQWVPGPAWVNDPPRPVPRAFFGATIGTNSGAMPGFRIGSVRSWDSETRWSNVQPDRHRYDWTPLDRMVAGAERAGRPMLHTMGMTPAWAAPDGPRSPYLDDSRTAAPRDLADWDRYVRALVTRYRGRIEAYELWDFANTHYHYTGDVETMVEMTRRAAAIIRAEDPRATVVCPSIGDLWGGKGRRWLARFAALDGFRPCDAVAVKFHPRKGDGPPEEMTELAGLIYNTLHNEGVHLPMWATGPAHSIPTVRHLGEEEANNHAVRFYLAGLYSRFSRMYFYSWGIRNLPLVLQVEGSPPTRAARFVDRLQQWLDGARIRSCGHGPADGLPEGAWQCRFELDEDGRQGAVRWMASGTSVMPAEPGAFRIDHLDGRTVPVRAGAAVRLGERPVLVRFRPAKGR